MTTVNLHPDRQKLVSLTCKTVEYARSILRSLGWTGTVTLGNADGADALDINATSPYDAQTVLGASGPGTNGGFCAPLDTTGALHIVSRAEACTTQPSNRPGVQYVACESLFCLEFDDYETIPAEYVYSGTQQWPTSSQWNGSNGPDGNPGCVGIGGAFGGSDSPRLVAAAGTTYRWRLWGWAQCATSTATVAFYDAADALLATHTLMDHPGDQTWREYEGDYTAPTGTAYMHMTAGRPPLCLAFYDDVCVTPL